MRQARASSPAMSGMLPARLPGGVEAKISKTAQTRCRQAHAEFWGCSIVQNTVFVRRAGLYREHVRKLLRRARGRHGCDLGTGSGRTAAITTMHHGQAYRLGARVAITRITAKNPLPSYAQSPTYVSPWHCRLCFQGFDVPCPTDQHSDIDDGGWKLHLQTHGFTSVAEYRQEFFRVCVATPWSR